MKKIILNSLSYKSNKKTFNNKMLLEEVMSYLPSATQKKCIVVPQCGMVLYFYDKNDIKLGSVSRETTRTSGNLILYIFNAG